MADGHLVRVTGGWLKWDKNHYKWENIEESTANKSENKSLVLKVMCISVCLPLVHIQLLNLQLQYGNLGIVAKVIKVKIRTALRIGGLVIPRLVGQVNLGSSGAT